jgi:hypothetical protein
MIDIRRVWPYSTHPGREVIWNVRAPNGKIICSRLGLCGFREYLRNDLLLRLYLNGTDMVVLFLIWILSNFCYIETMSVKWSGNDYYDWFIKRDNAHNYDICRRKILVFLNIILGFGGNGKRNCKLIFDIICSELSNFVYHYTNK